MRAAIRRDRSRTLKQTFVASITQEGDWSVAQCLDADVASQGESGEAALRNLGEALALHFAPPMAAPLPALRPIDVEIAVGNEETGHGTAVDHRRGTKR